MTVVHSDHQLFGPVQTDGCVKQIFGGNTWVFPGAALSASTKLFRFSRCLALADYAVWRLVWVPNGSSSSIIARLVHFDDGPNNITEICRISGNGSFHPVNAAAIFTDVYNELVNAEVDKNFGIQFWGAEGQVNYTEIYSSWLHVDSII